MAPVDLFTEADRRSFAIVSRPAVSLAIREPSADATHKASDNAALAAMAMRT